MEYSEEDWQKVATRRKIDSNRKDAKKQIDDYFEKIDNRFGVLFVCCFFLLAPCSCVLVCYILNPQTEIIIGLFIAITLAIWAVFFMFVVPVIKNKLKRKYIDELKELYREHGQDYYNAICWVENLYNGKIDKACDDYKRITI